MIDLVPGLYIHYKGGRYLVLFTAETHKHNGDIDVAYYSLTHKKHCIRPLRRDSRNEDSWLDVVMWPDNIQRNRFMHINHLERPDFESLEKIWSSTSKA
jgi:hypothetical protein